MKVIHLNLYDLIEYDSKLKHVSNITSQNFFIICIFFFFIIIIIKHTFLKPSIVESKISETTNTSKNTENRNTKAAGLPPTIFVQINRGERHQNNRNRAVAIVEPTALLHFNTTKYSMLKGLHKHRQRHSLS